MACRVLPDIVIVVSGTHWQCIPCKLQHKRAVSLDDHLLHNHPYVPPVQAPVVPVTAQPLSDGEEYEDIGQEESVVGRRNTKTKKSQSEYKVWLKSTDIEDSCDSGNDVIDNDNDSDFVPSQLDNKKCRNRERITRKTVKKKPKKDSVKQVKVVVVKQEVVIDSESITEPNPLCEPDDTNTKDDSQFKLKTKSARKTKSRDNKKRNSAGEHVELKPLRKRGRPPKPKPTPEEEEEPVSKRPYRKKVPDPSELLLKLRNVGRKPNNRHKLSREEREEIKTKYIHFVKKAELDTNVAQLIDRADVINAEQCTNSLPEDQGNVSSSDTIQPDRRELTNHVDNIASENDHPSSKPQGEMSCQEKIRCKICLCLFSSEKFLKEHENKVSAEDIYQCLVCDMKFHGLTDLNMHVFCDHEYEKQPACFLCREDFASMEKLEKHLNNQHKNEPDLKLSDTKFHDCRLCEMELNTDFQLIRNHYYRRHKAYVCSECYGKDVELLFYTDTGMYGEHKQMHARSPAECSICQHVFPTAREMKAHMWTHADDATDDGTGGKCDKCDKWLPNSGAMIMHEKEHKNEAIRKSYALEASIGFPCMKCEHIFSSKSNLKKHSCRADPSRSFKFHCEYCAYGCNTREQLRDHIALHHLGIKRYACDYCDQRFVCGPTLRRHIRRVHTKEKPYQCHLCSERFFERNLLLRHVSKHNGIASFVCEFCGKGFHTKFDMKKHVENHTDTRKFVCSNCGLDYKRSYHLKRHLEKGCKKKYVKAMDKDVPSVLSDMPLTAQEDADDMVYLDLAHEINIEEDDIDDGDINMYQDESSGPDLTDNPDDDLN